MPEKSLALFDAHWIGYEWRYMIEFKEFKGFSLLDGFNEFMCKKFRVPSNRGSLSIVNLYTKNQAEAFDLWFECIEEFRLTNDPESEVARYYLEWRDSDRLEAKKKIDFYGLVQAVVTRISSFVGTSSFSLLVTLLDGWVRAIEDFEFEETYQEKYFREFKAYLEAHPYWLRSKSDAIMVESGPSWDKLILEWTAHIQREEKAIEKFAKYFDEYAFQGKRCVEYVETHWKYDQEKEKEWDWFQPGKFLRKKI